MPVVKQMLLSFNPLSSACWGRDSENLVSLVTRLPVRFYHKGALDKGKAVGSDGLLSVLRLFLSPPPSWSYCKALRPSQTGTPFSDLGPQAPFLFVPPDPGL